MLSIPVILVFVVALALSSIAGAQQSLPTQPPPNPGKIVPDQRLENVEQRLLTAGEELRLAAEIGEDARTQRTLGYGRDTLESVRDVFDDLPAARRQPYLDAVAKTEQVLETGDPGKAAEAMKTLQQTIRDLAARGI
jgi:hypothetical protein